MKHERTVLECTFQASDTAAPCVILMDPDPLSARRVSHTARWTWTDEEAIFFASCVLSQLISDLQTQTRNRVPASLMAGMADTHAFLCGRIDPDLNLTKVVAQKKRLTPKRKRA